MSVCPKCGGRMGFIPPLNEWYCNNCHQYLQPMMAQYQNFPPPVPMGPNFFPYVPPQYHRAREQARMALIFGAIGLLVLGIVFGPIAIYLGMQAKHLDPTQGTAGIILGTIDIIIYVVVIAIFFTVLF